VFCNSNCWASNAVIASAGRPAEANSSARVLENTLARNLLSAAVDARKPMPADMTGAGPGAGAALADEFITAQGNKRGNNRAIIRPECYKKIEIFKNAGK
jgi:hypothetical protein